MGPGSGVMRGGGCRNGRWRDTIQVLRSFLTESLIARYHAMAALLPDAPVQQQQMLVSTLRAVLSHGVSLRPRSMAKSAGSLVRVSHGVTAARLAASHTVLPLCRPSC